MADRDEQRGEDPIEERLVHGKESEPGDIADAAEEAFVKDQKENPDHPSNIRREKVDEEDPTHSKGSEA